MALGVRWVVVGERERGLYPFTRSCCHYSGGDKPKHIRILSCEGSITSRYLTIERNQ